MTGGGAAPWSSPTERPQDESLRTGDFAIRQAGANVGSSAYQIVSAWNSTESVILERVSINPHDTSTVFVVKLVLPGDGSGNNVIFSRYPQNSNIKLDPGYPIDAGENVELLVKAESGSQLTVNSSIMYRDRPE
jgi:hypothetical protein